MDIKAGSTNVSVYYYIVQDASATSPGEPVTGLLFSDIETGGSASYARQGAARTDLTLITLASAAAAHADGGFILVDDTNMPGVYRCDYPDAAFVTGVDQVVLSIVVASAKNAVAAPIFVNISDNVDQTGDSYARLGVPAGASVSADIADVPTVAEFNARTLLAAAYFDPAADTVALVTDLTNLPSIPTNWLTAAGIAAGAMDGKGNWNVGKTGYALTQAFPTNFADMAITLTTGRVDINTNNDKAGYSISGAKTTLDALNDIPATDIVSGGAVNTTAGAVDTVTALSGHTAQTGDNYARLGAPTDTNIATDIANIQTDVNTTNTTLAGLNDLSAAQVNTEVVDALATDTYAESTATPAAVASITAKISYMFDHMVNKQLQTATLYTLRNRADSADISTATVSDDGTTATKGTES